MKMQTFEAAGAGAAQISEFVWTLEATDQNYDLKHRQIPELTSYGSYLYVVMK